MVINTASDASQLFATRAMAMTDEPRDPITRLQLKTASICELYKTALGNIMNQAEVQLHPNAQPDPNANERMETMANEYAALVVKAHGEFEELAKELQGAHRSEAEQLQELAKLQAEHEAVTQELRTKAAAAEVVHTRLRDDIDQLLDGIHEISAEQSAANL